MASIVESGIPPSAIFGLVAKFEEYGELAKEMKKVARNIEVFGLDPLTAIREVAKRTPSKSFKEILNGFVSTIETGGSIVLFLRNAGQQALFEWRMKRERFLGKLSTYAEFYTGILIAAPLFIVALFSVMAIVQPVVGGIHILRLMEISIYFLLPALNVGFLMFLKGTEVAI
jgi:flagellar protein FlaJ